MKRTHLPGGLLKSAQGLRKNRVRGFRQHGRNAGDCAGAGARVLTRAWTNYARAKKPLLPRKRAILILLLDAGRELSENCGLRF